MEISASMVKDLRERTGAGMMDCKKALDAAEGNMDKATDWLRENGIAKAAKKEGRIAAEGTTKMLVNGNKAIMLEVNSMIEIIPKVCARNRQKATRILCGIIETG